MGLRADTDLRAEAGLTADASLTADVGLGVEAGLTADRRGRLLLSPGQEHIGSRFKFSNRSTNAVYEPLTLGQFSKVSKSILRHLITLLHWKQIVDRCN